jgi:hypothetical protein
MLCMNECVAANCSSVLNVDGRCTRAQRTSHYHMNFLELTLPTFSKSRKQNALLFLRERDGCFKEKGAQVFKIATSLEICN